MAFDTFDEGIVPGGMRSKYEIRILICYLLNSIKEPVSKEIIVDSICEESLANYFETSSCFDDLIEKGNIIEEGSDGDIKTYTVSENGVMIANQLDTILAYTVKEKAYDCAINLLAQKKKERENSVEIVKTDMGYNVNCKISGGNLDLLSFSIFAPDMPQAQIIKKNFYDNPTNFYKVILAMLTQKRKRRRSTRKSFMIIKAIDKINIKK